MKGRVEVWEGEGVGRKERKVGLVSGIDKPNGTVFKLPCDL